jgi:hypothetical protein
VIEEGTEGSESSKKSMTDPLLGSGFGEIQQQYRSSSSEMMNDVEGGGGHHGGSLSDGVHVHATKVVRRKCRLKCCPTSANNENKNKKKEETVYTPLTDLPSTVPSHGPHFRHEINDMMRIVDEGKGVRKITRYREQRMVRHGWMKAKIWHATYLSSTFCWLQILYLWLFTGLVAAVTYCLLYRVNTKTIESLQSGLTIASNIQTLVAFTLGFYLQKTIDIWWNLRHDTLQQLMNIVDNMCLRMAIYFPGQTKEDEQARETIMRYGLLSLALLFKDAREVDVWSEEEAKAAGALDMNDLMEEGLLTPHEATLLEGIPAKSQMCWVWISSLFTKWCLDGRLPDPLGNQNTMLVYSEEARNAISTILAQLNMQFPLSYAHLIIFFSKLYMVMLGVEAGISVGSSFHHTNYSDVISKALILTLSPILYQGILEIKEHISNPFRDDITDYSFKMFHARLRNECTAFFNCAMNPPYATVDEPEPAVLPPQFLERQVNTAMYDFDAR